MQIIKSLLDQDLYKLTMMQAVLHNYPSAIVEYKFKCRNGSGFPKQGDKFKFIYDLKTQIDNLCSLRFQEHELEYLRQNFPYFTSDFIEYLRLFKLSVEHVKVSVSDAQELEIVVNGPWVSTILFEVPVLAIVSELLGYYDSSGSVILSATADKNLKNKIDFLKTYLEHRGEGFKFADFGTRRRFSAVWHEHVLANLIDSVPETVSGTSNLFLAEKYNLTPIGTMAHEWLQAHQQLGVRLVDSQKQALEVWTKEYRGELGIALSDCVGFDAFLRDFDKYFAKLFDGCRHDSGDPNEWCKRLINHYTELGIDPKTKTAIFSDGLNFVKATGLYESFNSHINTGFGIGTYLTHDMGTTAPQIVMKLTKVNGLPVAKISDSPGKCMTTDKEYISYLKKVFEIKGV